MGKKPGSPSNHFRNEPNADLRRNNDINVNKPALFDYGKTVINNR